MKAHGAFGRLSKALSVNGQPCLACFLILLAVSMTTSWLTAEVGGLDSANSIANENQAGILEVIEMKGMVSLGGAWQLSLRDTETGKSFWLREGQEHRGIKIAHVDGLNRSANLVCGGTTLELRISDASDTIMWLRSGKVTLSRYNSKLLKAQHKLIKIKRSESTGRLIRNNTAQQALESFILTNPSVNEVATLISELPEIYDMEAFLGIPFEGVHGRSNQDTAGWGVRKDLDFSELVDAIQKGASIDVINKILEPEDETT